MLSVRNKLGTISSLGLLLALVAVVSLTVLNGPSRRVRAQGEVIAVDYSSVVSQAPSGYGTNIWWTDEDADIWTARFAELSPSPTATLQASLPLSLGDEPASVPSSDTEGAG